VAKHFDLVCGMQVEEQDVRQAEYEGKTCYLVRKAASICLKK
jgi:YHS domain-containing protein